MNEGEMQLVVGTQCCGCGQELTAETVGRVTPRGKFTGPLGVCRICAGVDGTSIPSGMVGGTPGE